MRKIFKSIIAVALALMLVPITANASDFKYECSITITTEHVGGKVSKGTGHCKDVYTGYYSQNQKHFYVDGYTFAGKPVTNGQKIVDELVPIEINGNKFPTIILTVYTKNVQKQTDNTTKKPSNTSGTTTKKPTNDSTKKPSNTSGTTTKKPTNDSIKKPSNTSGTTTKKPTNDSTKKPATTNDTTTKKQATNTTDKKTTTNTAQKTEQPKPKTYTLEELKQKNTKVVTENGKYFAIVGNVKQEITEQQAKELQQLTEVKETPNTTQEENNENKNIQEQQQKEQQKEQQQEKTKTKTTNWYLPLGIAVGITVIGGVTYYILRKRNLNK